MLFDEIPGQQSAKDSLKGMVREGRLPHAMLFLGPRGSGKLALALATARYLLCERRAETGQACGEASGPQGADGPGFCANCRKTSRFIHPDLHFSIPTVGPRAISDSFLDAWREAIQENPWLDHNAWMQAIGAENKQGNITRQECENIIRKLSLKPFEAENKVLIMWMPELLGNEGNTLLKLVEEPPDQTIIILVGEDQERILPTLISRCQLVPLLPLSDDEVIEGLAQRFPGLGERAEEIAFQAQGQFDEALRLAAEKENDNSALFFTWLRLCYTGNGVEMVKWCETFARLGRENQKHFLLFGLHFLREFIQLKALGPARARLGQTEVATAGKLDPLIDLDQTAELVSLFDDCIQAVERNANPKILFLNASIRINRIMKGKPKGTKVPA